jgi:aminocarboxymuconate-semialdehyde decarboxylase
MKIDIAAHITPQKYVDAVRKYMPEAMKDLLESTPTIVDLDSRFRIMDKYPDMVQVLTIAGPLGGPHSAQLNQVEITKIANEALAELVLLYPDRFVAAVAVLPLNDMDAALTELDRAIKDLKLRGILVNASYINKPLDSAEFMPLYQKMSDYDLPIWIHPWRPPYVSDYADEKMSMYRIWHVWGWPYETTAAMARLVFSGVMEKFPKLKVITHHCGAMVPFFEQRIVSNYDYFEKRLNEDCKAGLTKDPLDYFRMYYGDTAVSGSTPALMCGYAFFGAEHMLFGTDMPHDMELGDMNISDTIRSIDDMEIPEEDKKKIFEDNARNLLKLTV